MAKLLDYIGPEALTRYEQGASSAQPDFYSAPVDIGQRRALRAAQTEVRNTERDLARYGIDVEAEMPQPSTLSTLLDPIFDALQIGQFVTAGTALEIQKSGLSREVLKRAASEFANALPGIEVEDVADFYGIKFPKATRPSWSEVLKKTDAKIFNDDGYGKWSAAAAGFALDILLDPMTYVNPLGIAKKIPGAANLADAFSGWAKGTGAGTWVGRKVIADFDLKEWARKNPTKAESAFKFIESKKMRDIEEQVGSEDLINQLKVIGQDMNAAEIRLIHLYMQDPQMLKEVVDIAAMSNPEKKMELLKKADLMKKFYKEVGEKDAQAGMFSPAVLDFYSVDKSYVPGRHPTTPKTDQASIELVQRLKDRGIDVEEQLLGKPTTTGDVGPNFQLGTGTPTAAHRKKYMTMPERVNSGTPTDLDLTLTAQRGLESVRWGATQRFVKAVLNDETIARKIESGHVGELFGRTEDDFFRELVKGGMAKETAEVLARNKFEELGDFTKRLQRDGYGIWRPMRKGESAYVLPEPFIRELDLSNKIMEGKTESHKFLRQIQDLQNIWKGYAVLSPGFHARNAMSNWWNNTLAGVKTPNYYKAYLLQRGIGEEISVKVGDTIYKGEELFQLARKHGVVGTGIVNKDLGLDVERQVLGSVLPKASGRELEKPLKDAMLDLAADVAGTAPQRNVGDAFKAILGPDNYVLRGNRIVGRAIENNSRLAHFIDRLDKGASIKDAAFSTKKYLFDYNELTDFEKDWMKTVIPFYAWMRFNIPLQFQSLLEKPGRYAAMTAKPIQEIESLSSDWQDIPTPDYFQEIRAVRLPKEASEVVAYLNRQISGAEDTGLQPTYLNPNLPFQDINRLGPQDILSGLSPLLKFPFEQTPSKGFSFFLDRDIERYPGEPAATDVLGTGIRLSGKNENAARSLLPTYGKIQRMREKGEQGQLAGQLLTEIAGIKAIQVDIDRINRAKTYSKRETLRNLKQKLREMERIP